MKQILITLTSLLLVLSCNKSEQSEDIPQCIEEKIKDFKTKTVCDLSQVAQYMFQNQTVFVFDNQPCCCDFTGEVLDSNCKVLGSLGGIAGLFKINGEDFSKATFIRVVWKK
jgi:hypothetical protein